MNHCELAKSHQLPLVGFKTSLHVTHCREDLKHPPTAVGGIRLFAQKPCPIQGLKQRPHFALSTSRNRDKTRFSRQLLRNNFFVSRILMKQRASATKETPRIDCTLQTQRRVLPKRLERLRQPRRGLHDKWRQGSRHRQLQKVPGTQPRKFKRRRDAEEAGREVTIEHRFQRGSLRLPCTCKPISLAGKVPKSSTSQVLPFLSRTRAAGISIP